MSTISSLPNAILVEIFKSYLTLPKGGLDFHDDLRFVLLAVCHDWRTFVMNEPSLWQTIEINALSVIPRHPQDFDIDPVAIFYRPCIAFQCAREFPVELTIELPTDNKFFNLYHCALLAEILRREAPRIWSLTVTGDNWPMHLCTFSGLENVPMPHLHTFVHDVWSGVEISEEERRDEPFPFLQYPTEDEGVDSDAVNQWGRELYPNLTHLEISGAPYDFCLLPTSGLEEFGLCFVPNDRCPPWLIPAMLEYSVDTLENLWIIGSLNREDEDDDINRHVVLPKLRKLHIEFEGPDEVAHFIPFIRTPALEHLELSDTLTSQLPEDEQQSSDDMLTAMMLHLPLDQLQRLFLTGVVFNDEITVPEPDAFLVKGQVSPQDTPVTLRFLASLTSLRLLSLCLLEDDRFLSLLNYPRTPNFDENGEVLPAGAMQGSSRHLPLLPALECLRLTAVSPAKAAQVHEFMDDRAFFTVWERLLNVIVEGSDDTNAVVPL